MVKSPCVNICIMDKVTGLCNGCRRTDNEINNWIYYNDNKKISIIKILDSRIMFNNKNKKN